MQRKETLLAKAVPVKDSHRKDEDKDPLQPAMQGLKRQLDRLSAAEGHSGRGRQDLLCAVEADRPKEQRGAAEGVRRLGFPPRQIVK